MLSIGGYRNSSHRKEHRIVECSSSNTTLTLLSLYIVCSAVPGGPGEFCRQRYWLEKTTETQTSQCHVSMPRELRGKFDICWIKSFRISFATEAETRLRSLPYHLNILSSGLNQAIDCNADRANYPRHSLLATEGRYGYMYDTGAPNTNTLRVQNTMALRRFI